MVSHIMYFYRDRDLEKHYQGTAKEYEGSE